MLQQMIHRADQEAQIDIPVCQQNIGKSKLQIQFLC